MNGTWKEKRDAEISVQKKCGTLLFIKGMHIYRKARGLWDKKGICGYGTGTSEGDAARAGSRLRTLFS